MFTGLLRTIILYILIIAGIRLMGKRQVGELEPSELVLSLIIADLASVPMLWHPTADRRGAHPYPAVPYHDSVSAHHEERPFPGADVRTAQHGDSGGNG